MKTNKNYSLAVILFLLTIFVPFTIFGYVYKKNNKAEENPNHELFYNNKLWFYDNNDKLINKYDCQNSNCNLAKSNMDLDIDYNINYYKDGTEEIISTINNKYAFIQDGEYINLYDIELNKTIQTYLNIKNYNTTLTDNIFILQNKDNFWGILFVGDIVNMVIPFEYDFIGLKNDLDDNKKLKINNYIVKKENNWFLINSNNEKLTSDFETVITDYSDKYIVSNKDNIEIYDYKNNKYNINNKIDKYIFESDFTGIINDNKLFIYQNLNDNYLKEININNSDKISLKHLDNILYIYENNLLLDTYNI